ncbi:MAG: hypothetical protein IPN02_06705 [Candidatus Microthrix sp.]|uniref:Uncharacterized protein n=1 Tax=Candidatus Neomicrothrix subdominans TaxID=2954438 RepID=A0A936TEC0_9ACTN|nr:hypothetical protein [Candidatus Microthrix subdominans]
MERCHHLSDGRIGLGWRHPEGCGQIVRQALDRPGRELSNQLGADVVNVREPAGPSRDQ